MYLIALSVFMMGLVSGGLYSDEVAWRIGGKIHFEEHSGSDYVGTLELNKVTRQTLKEFFNIKSDFCADNAKVLLKKENGRYVIGHYEERSKPGMGEEMHATLLYTRKRAKNGHETLKEVYQNLTEIDERLPRKGIPSVQQVAEAYQKIISPKWKFKISDVVFVRGKTGNCIIAKLLFEEKDEIVNEKGHPISGNFLHVTLANIHPSAMAEEEKLISVVYKLKEKFLDKMIKIGERHGQADLEFGVSGSKERVRP